MPLDFSIFNPKSRGLVGLDISSSSIKIVELSGDKGKFRVERYVVEILPREAVADGNIVNLEATAETVRRAWKRMDTSIKQCAIALPASHVITKKIIVAEGLREDELDLQVESEANQYIPFALDEVNLDYQIIGPAASSEGELEVLIAASRKEKVEDRVAVVEAAGLKPVVMDIESFAVQSAFEFVKQNIGKTQDKNIALIDIGANVMHLVVMRNDQPVYSREQAFGGNQLTQNIARLFSMTFEEAEAEKRRNKLPENYFPEVLQPFVESLALEVSRALQFFFTSTQYNQIDQIVLAGGCAILDGVDKTVASRTQIKTTIADPFVTMAVAEKYRKGLQIDAPSLMVACGLALRRFDE